MQKLSILWIACCCSILISAQNAKKNALVFTDAAALKLMGQAFPLKSYHRIDTGLHRNFSAGIKNLLTHSAGLTISFKTNSPRIAAKWCVGSDKPSGNNMAAIASKGLDLYIKKEGKWQFAGVGRPKGVCNEFELVKDMEPGEKECLLYLPLYDAIKSLSIGVEEGYNLSSGSDPFAARRVVIYGSSITQGASASRPGMAYPARLSRAMGIQFINLGLSGSGKMEKEVADMVASIDAEAFIMDCFANPSPEQIAARTAYMVKAIRAKHPQAPIIMIQSVVRERGNFDLVSRAYVKSQNDNALKVYQSLLKEGVSNLHLIPGDQLLGGDHEGTTDGTHPNDIGFDRMLQVIQPALIPILK